MIGYDELARICRENDSMVGPSGARRMTMHDWATELGVEFEAVARVAAQRALRLEQLEVASPDDIRAHQLAMWTDGFAAGLRVPRPIIPIFPDGQQRRQS